MDNNTNDTFDPDKYTNYTYQNNDPGAPAAGAYSAPDVHTYSAPDPAQNQTQNAAQNQSQNAASYGQPDFYAAADPYAQTSPYAPSDPYAQPGQNNYPSWQPGQYAQPTQNTQSGQYAQPVRYTQPGQYEQYIYNGGAQTAAPVKAGKGLSIAAMICGIASICTLNFIPGIIALCLSKNFRRANSGAHNGFSKAGKICGIFGIILSAIFIFVYIIIIAAMIFEETTGLYF